MAQAATEEKTTATTGQDQTNDPIGDWVANTVGLPQYKNAFKAIEFTSLSAIGTLSKQDFSDCVKSIIGQPVNYQHLSAFTQAHANLSNHSQSEHVSIDESKSVSKRKPEEETECKFICIDKRKIRFHYSSIWTRAGTDIWDVLSIEFPKKLFVDLENGRVLKQNCDFLSLYTADDPEMIPTIKTKSQSSKLQNLEYYVNNKEESMKNKDGCVNLVKKVFQLSGEFILSRFCLISLFLINLDFYQRILVILDCIASFLAIDIAVPYFTIRLSLLTGEILFGVAILIMKYFNCDAATHVLSILGAKWLKGGMQEQYDGLKPPKYAVRVLYEKVKFHIVLNLLASIGLIAILTWGDCELDYCWIVGLCILICHGYTIHMWYYLRGKICTLDCRGNVNSLTVWLTNSS